MPTRNHRFLKIAAATAVAVVIVVVARMPPAFAQPSQPAQSIDCAAEQTTLQSEMDIARSRGRMLQRRQIAEELLAVQARCGAIPPARSRALQIESLQKDILEMRKELDRAETELHRLRQQPDAPVTSG